MKLHLSKIQIHSHGSRVRPIHTFPPRRQSLLLCLPGWLFISDPVLRLLVAGIYRAFFLLWGLLRLSFHLPPCSVSGPLVPGPAQLSGVECPHPRHLVQGVVLGSSAFSPSVTLFPSSPSSHPTEAQFVFLVCFKSLLILSSRKIVSTAQSLALKGCLNWFGNVLNKGMNETH